jgi:hypothetical protein
MAISEDETIENISATANTLFLNPPPCGVGCPPVTLSNLDFLANIVPESIGFHRQNFPLGSNTDWGVCQLSLCALSPLGIGPDGVFANGKVIPAASVPGPVAGAGLPGLILAGGVLLTLARRRRQLM